MLQRSSIWILVFVTACSGGGGGNGTTSPPPAGGFTIFTSNTTSSVAQGGTSSVTVTVARTGSFTGPVSLQPTGMPAGVTAVFTPASVPPTETASTLTFTAGATATAGTFPITITGNGSGASHQTLTIQLTVTAAPAQTGPFTLSISATSFLVLPSNHVPANPIITITRNAGFTGPISFSTSGLPPTLFVGFSPSNTSGSAVTALILNAGTPNGTYTAQIRGASAQGDRTIPLQIVVAPPSTGSIKWKWCSGSSPRYFVAVRDGAGPWMRLMPTNDSVYSFNLTSTTGQLAEVTIDSGGFRTTLHQFTAQEMAARGQAQCRLIPNVSTRTASGSFGGVTGFRMALVGMAWWFGSANGNGNFTMLNLPSGPLDVVAARNGEITVPSVIPVDRLIIRRGINPPPGGSIPVLDFTATESFAPTVAQWTFLNTNGESFGVSQTFTTVGGTTGLLHAVPGIDGTATTRTIYGVPLAQTLAGDLHQLVATVATVDQAPGGPIRGKRQIVHYGRTLGVPHALAFGPALPAPTVSVAAPGRLRVQGTLPAEYTAGASFDLTQTSTARFFSIHATRGFLGAGTAYALEMPDLSGVLGWDTQFAVRPGIATNWWVSGGGPTLDFFDVRYPFFSYRSQWTGALTGVTAPADGATYLFARAFGTAVP
ncbi:MAG TPA: hypothetical protein VFZ73_04385 [Gemmatimonadaceae bacterium]